MSTSTGIERPRSIPARMVVVGLILALSVIALPGRAMADAASDADAAAELVNQSRASYGLPRLIPDRELQVIANRRANRMAGNGYLSHTPNLGDQLSWGWWAWAENVGGGPDVGWVHGAFMRSWLHSSNILDPAFNYVGVGVAYGSDGTVYVAQVFGAW